MTIRATKRAKSTHNPINNCPRGATRAVPRPHTKRLIDSGEFCYVRTRRRRFAARTWTMAPLWAHRHVKSVHLRNCDRRNFLPGPGTRYFAPPLRFMPFRYPFVTEDGGIARETGAAGRLGFVGINYLRPRDLHPPDAQTDKVINWTSV